MSYNLPTPTPETQPFWEGAAQGRLRLTYCLDTGQYFFYPRRFSPFTGSANVEWRDVSGEGTLYSYIINYRPLPGRQLISPIIALVKLVEGPVIMSSLVGITPDPSVVKLDMALLVEFHAIDDIYLPVFRPKGT